MNKIFTFIKADQFFKHYCPEIKNYKHKLRGKSGREKDIDFTPADYKAIKSGLKKLFKDLINL